MANKLIIIKIYSCKTLYMFRTVFPSIIRSSRLHIRQKVYVKQLLLPAASGDEMELQKDALFLKLFILVERSTCFGRSFRPSSGAQDCTYACCRMCSLELLMIDGKTV